MKKFSKKDVDLLTPMGGNVYKRIFVDYKDLVYSPLPWQELGLRETSSGYGKRLTSRYKISYEGKLYRVYTTIFSNNGTSWFIAKGEKIIIS